MWSQGTAIALHVVNEAMQIGLAYLGAGLVVWLLVAVVALWMR
jgi:hypothetical protein